VGPPPLWGGFLAIPSRGVWGGEAGPGGGGGAAGPRRGSGWLRAVTSGKLRPTMFLDANALGYSAALLATFLGIGVLVNALIFYTVAQVLAEHRENQERKERRE